MSAMRFVKAVMVASTLMFAVPAAAQSTVTTSDIQRLQDDIYQASTDISRLRSTDATGAARMQDELDDLRDEAVYLKVKLRKDGRVDRSEYSEVRDRVQNLRSRVRSEGSTGWSSNQSQSGGGSGTSDNRETRDSRPSTSTSSTRRTTIPAGQEIDVRLERPLSSETAQVEDRFEATTVVDMYDGNRVIIPAGSSVRGIVSSVNKAGHIDRRGSMTLSFDQVTVRGRDYRMRGVVTQALESGGFKDDAAKIGAGSAVGAIIGGIIGGGKGALIGVLIGGGGTVAATEGKDVELTPGTVLRIRLDEPPDIR